MIGKQVASHGSIEGAATLPDIGVLEIAGPDAAAFLHAQTMNDVRALADGHWHWNGVLSPKGRVLSLFALLRRDAERWWAVVPDLAAAELAEHLRRFVFRSKLTLAARGDLEVHGLLAPDMLPAGSAGAGARAGGDEVRTLLDFGGAVPRQLVVTACGDAPLPDGPETLREHWRALDLRHGLPRLGPAQRDQYTPQMLGLERLRAFSLSKGCYPGQEIVARTHYLGQAKRTAMLLHTASCVEPGSELLADGARAGVVVAAATDDSNGGGALALAVATPLATEAELRIGAVPARPGSLLDGLAR